VKDTFASSVFPNDPSMTKKMMSTIKTIYLTRWLEYITPVPGGPNNPESGRRGYRKNAPNPGVDGTSDPAPDNRGDYQDDLLLNIYTHVDIYIYIFIYVNIQIYTYIYTYTYISP
jgi:hypothetical protein